jgi:hypothetical protein
VSLGPRATKRLLDAGPVIFCQRSRLKNGPVIVSVEIAVERKDMRKRSNLRSKAFGRKWWDGSERKHRKDVMVGRKVVAFHGRKRDARFSSTKGGSRIRLRQRGNGSGDKREIIFSRIVGAGIAWMPRGV